MDLYEKKFAEMQKYIPFLEAMIERLKKVKDKSREPQLQKMQSLHGILSKSNGKKLTIEKLDRCEELLLKLHSRVDKGNAGGSNIQSNKSNEEAKPNITGNSETEAASSAETDKDSDMNRKKSTKDETPASPSPPASPDQTSQPKIHIKPIIIPTERSDGYTGTTLDDRPASPDECEMVASVGLRQPVIIPTEQLDTKPKFNPLRKTDPDTADKKIPRWNFSVKANQSSTPQKSNLWQSDPPAGLITTVGGNTSTKITPESRPRILRHIPTVPTPSKGASLIRKPVLVLDKKNAAGGSETESPTSKWDSPSVSDSDSHQQKTIEMSPKSKELPPLPKLPASRLLVAPPPVLEMPPLTTEDLAELLSDDADSNTGRKPVRRADKETDKVGASTSKDGRPSKSFDDVESDRRWEEEYKHIVKMPSRRVFTSPSGTPVKHSDIMKFPPAQQPAPQVDRPTDPRKRPPSPVPKERDPPPAESRYADNYEKHPRPPRDLHSHNSIPDHNQTNSAFPRNPDGDPNNSLQNDERNSAHYNRRPYGPPMHDQPSSDPRREKSEYYRMMHQQEMQQNRGPQHHSPGRSSDPCNQQWGQNSNYPPGPQGPQGPNMQYQQQRPDMWTMKAGGNNVPMEPHMMGDPAYMRQGQYPQGPNNCRGPMMSPQDMNHGPCMDPGFRDDQSMIPPLIPQMVPPPHGSGMPPMMQPQGYPVGGQYRGFPPENRQNVQQFDRPQDFPHPRQSWDQPVNRPPENIQYPRQPQSGQWNRNNRGGPPQTGPGPSAPPGSAGPINRDRPYNDRGRAPEPPRPSGFNRDPRTRVDAPAQQLQQQNSPNSQNNVRRDYVPPPAQNANPSAASGVRRDPRVAKDAPQAPATKPKDHAQSNDLNPRRNFETKSKHISSKDVRRSNEKSRQQYNKHDKKGGRRESENENKIAEKPSKDVMQSPLQSLYGVIDTNAKTGKGYGLQKFKIPKIKRPDPVPSPPRVDDTVVEENWDSVDENTAQYDDVNANDRVDDSSRVEAPPVSKEADDKKSEVTSTTGESLEDSRVSKETVPQTNDASGQKETPVQSTVESEAVDTSSKSTDAVPAKTKELDIASLDNAGILDNILEARILEYITTKGLDQIINSKTLEQIIKAKKLKLIAAESTDGSDEDNEESESKKASKKKRRLKSRRRLSSDSSEEECLAGRLGMDENTEKNKATNSRVDDSVNEDPESVSKENTEAANQESSKNAIELSNDASRDSSEAPSKKGKPFRRKKSDQKPKTGLARELQQLIDDAQSMNEMRESAHERAKEQAPKTKTRRRNSLEMLQEDVREMFISDEVVTATGFRSCRLQKEDQQHLNSSVENLSLLNSKKKGSTSSLDRRGAKSESDGDDVFQEPTRGRLSRTRSRRRTSGRSKQRLSKEIISSDSETEDSSRIDPTHRNDNTDVGKTEDESLRSDAVGEAAKSKDDNEDAHFLRRSERVGLRGSMKEPRIHIRKSDSGKMDSKIMFDSSSDESFTIDVSELTAAVDISLHPEPQNASSPAGKTAGKSAASKKRRASRKRGNAAKTVEEKVDNVASADEVDSIASDLSRASSLTRGKKATAAAGKLDTNEELLSDILTGLVDPKASGDGENDGATTPTAEAKANTRKKKKKKPSWQMGILRKKKKKLQSPIPPAGIEAEELAATESKLESSFEIPESKVDPTEFPIASERDQGVEPKDEVLSDSAASKTAENAGGDESPLVTKKEEPSSPVKSQTQETNVEDEIDEKKPLDDSLDDNKSDIELNAEGLPNVSVKKLMGYVWSTRRDKYKCMLCSWNGKNIVHHYTLGHPGKEMMISRLTIPEAKRAVTRAMHEKYDEKVAKKVTKETRKFTCRFCGYTTEGSSATALEAFYEHCTTHTGEYRFRCNCCPYQTVARSSMKTHYYRKACRNKYHGNMSLAICEDPVPGDDFLFGYLCTKCHFVQLKESNVHKHVKSFHDKCGPIDIVKIDMSSFVDKDLYDSVVSEENERVSESNEANMDDPLADTDKNDSASTVLNVSGTVDSDPMDIVDEALKDETEAGKSAESEAEPTLSQEAATESPPVAGNLSAFVCPPELENKEDEIQHERRKKMQEVVENIGISNKASEKRDLSIIDKLKDKMTTNIDESIAEDEAKREAEAAREKAAEVGLPVLLPESVTSLANGESSSKKSQPPENVGERSQELPEASVKTEPADSGDQVPEVPHDEAETDAEDKTEKKPKDPLANLEEPRKDDSSDDDDSDRDAAPEKPRNYESDTTDQSDAEIAADVNSLLEETFNINATTNDPMMTTIQRLAAKLQGEKSLPVSGGENTDTAESAETTETAPATEGTTEEAEKIIPKPPNAIPISSIQRFLGRRNAMLQEVAKEVGQTVEEPPPVPTPASPPKKFIRLRRLSGDKLSVPGPAPEPPVPPVPLVPPVLPDLAVEVEVPQPPSVDETPTEPPVEIVATVAVPENEEECSFLRIENVVSLAPGAENNPNETMINDIRKAVASSPKAAVGVSLLKKSSPNILKRPVVVRPAQLPVVSVQPGSPQLPKQNVKLVKVIKGKTLLKQKDSTHRIFGAQLKNPENFAEMIKPEKLRQFYKCMARACSFSTDCLQSFETHYRHHKETVDRTQMLLTSYDFQRCAYCSETLTTWNAMSEHLQDKHVYCQFQCSYCFYRALAQSYVELHQANVHQGANLAVLLGAPESPPIEVIDRREFVIPFVCNHECGKSFYVPGAFLAHLRTKHGNSLSIFKCHLCPAPLFKAEQLVSHYKLHKIFKYQCLYCIFGSEQSSDVHAHLSASHYNRPPHILERTLQPRPVRDKDVIQQLVVLNVDEGYKCTEITLVPGQKITDVPKNKHWLQVDRNTTDGSAVGVVTLPIANIGMNRLFPYEKLDNVDPGKSPETPSTACNPATPIITKFRKVLMKKSPENVLIVDETGAVRKVAKVSDPIAVENATNDSPAKDQFAETEKPADAVRLNPPSLHCDEEFVNINILDDPAFINAGDSRTATTSSVPMPANLEQKDKNEDSDIEILDDIEISSSKTTSKPSVIKIASTEIPKEQKETSKEEKAPGADVDPVILCSSTENSLDLNLDANPAEELDKSSERFLTLEDIRNTGYTGRNLYRCGYDSCEFGAETAELLRTHIKECIFATEAKNLNCVHCSKRFVKTGFLLEHFKLHGLKRFGCSMCKDRWTQPYQAVAHMKMKHRTTGKLLPADPKNPSADGLFVIEAVPANGEKPRAKKRGRAKSTETDKFIEVQKLTYDPSELESLPRQPIYQQEVQCAVCPYKNKVRINIYRHLQLHAKDETVPESGPVNPVPCLDKNERMFDKMVNLASSSHQNGRMGGTKTKEAPVDSGADLLPKFVPENKRYVCGVTECNYLSIDEGMLRTHQKALHPDEPYFRCPHCPAQVPGHEAQNIPIDKMGIHLKMHDTRLYKCSHCNHHHYHRHVVERHLADKHPEVNPFVKVIREIENTENTQQQPPQEAEENSADPDGNHWKCNLCDFKCIYKADMQTHASSSHEEKAQFKCTLCTYKTNNKITLDMHMGAKHGTDINADFTMVFQKIKGTGTKRPATEAGEAGGLDEPFDTTPLWRRDMPRVRHIRGILFEDEEPTQSETPAKAGKRKSEAEISTKPAKLKPTKSVNDSSSTDRDNDSWSSTILSDTSMTTDDFLDLDNLGPTSVRIDTSRLTRKFGPYGSPIAHFWRCTICQCFKTKYKHDMRDHLYRDLKYFRYRCTLCGYSGVSKNSCLKHFMRSHENRRPTSEEQETLPVDEDLETWVKTLLKSQSAQMRGMIVDEDGNIIGEAKPKKTNVLIARKTLAEPSAKTNTTNITQSPLKDNKLLAQTVDLTTAINEMKSNTMAIDADCVMQEVEDEDSNDHDALVIDSKDDGLEQEAPDNAAIIDDCEPVPVIDSEHLWACKHCTMKFGSQRGFKLHVQIRHLQRLNYLCPYCDTSSNSEKQMRKHLRLRHSNLPEQVNQNPARNLPDLTPEFWEKEYGLVGPEKPEKGKKRKRQSEESAQAGSERLPGPAHVCGTCGFRAINYFGLGVHMRTHTTVKKYKCAYCTFAASEKSELWQHSEQNHGHLDWRVGNGDAAFAETSEATKTESSSADRAVEDYAEYVAAEASASGSAPAESKPEITYVCFYCSTSRKSVDSLKDHWKVAHKNTIKPPSKSVGLPFRYKESTGTSEKKILRCGYCPKRGLAATIRNHSKKKHPSKPVKFIEIPASSESWVCEWCGEIVDCEAKKKVHQKMFHSHLPPRYARPQSNPENPGTSAEPPIASCPKCSFKTVTLAAMQKHVAKHVDSVRCKRCDKTFPDVTVAILHNTQAHPGEVSAIEGFTANVEKIMAKVTWRTAESSGKMAASSRNGGGVAKKSTTKSMLAIHPTPTKFRAVARKSTNPVARYAPGTRFVTDDVGASEPVRAVSYYGLPRDPVNLNKISTSITLGGGAPMKLNCTTLAQLINIEPRVLVNDLKRDLTNSVLFKTENS